MSGLTPRRARRVRRGGAAIAIAALVIAGLVVHLALPDTSASDIAGDALYAVAVYAGIVLVAPGLRPIAAALIAAAFCIAIELFQLTGIPLRLGSVFPPAMLVLGTVFDPRDLVVYPAAVGVAWAVDVLVGAAVARNYSRRAGSVPRHPSP